MWFVNYFIEYFFLEEKKAKIEQVQLLDNHEKVTIVFEDFFLWLMWWGVILYSDSLVVLCH